MLEIGSTAEAAYVADDDDMASSFCIAEQNVFPSVSSTARMIALMETAGARALKLLLQAGQLSVGVNGRQQASCGRAQPHTPAPSLILND